MFNKKNIDKTRIAGFCVLFTQATTRPQLYKFMDTKPMKPHLSHCSLFKLTVKRQCFNSFIDIMIS